MHWALVKKVWYRLVLVLISKAVSEVFKHIFHQIQTFYDKLHFYSLFKQFWVIKNSKPIPEKIEKINCKANAKAISTLYTKLPHFEMISVLSDITGFAFTGGNKNTLISLEIELFGVIILKHTFLYKELFTKDSTTPY